jgi:hypothetical protein
VEKLPSKLRLNGRQNRGAEDKIKEIFHSGTPDPPTSTSWALGLQVCATIPGHATHFIQGTWASKGGPGTNHPWMLRDGYTTDLVAEQQKFISSQFRGLDVWEQSVVGLISSEGSLVCRWQSHDVLTWCVCFCVQISSSNKDSSHIGFGSMLMTSC